MVDRIMTGSGQDHDEGHDEVDRGEGGLAGEVRHEQAVHDAVDGSENDHGDRGRCESEQRPEREMLCHRLSHNCPL